MIDVSVLMPAIRTPFWKNMFHSLRESCSIYKFELVLVSPFDLPDELKSESSINLVKDYGSPTRAAQIGLTKCQGRLVYHCTDDALFYPKQIDRAIFMYDETCRRKDCVNMRYREGFEWSGGDYPSDYWMAYYHDSMRLPGVKANWKIAHHHLIDNGYLHELGGYDCSYEYMTHALCDVMFRLQCIGGKIFDSTTHVTTCNQFANETVDHSPVHHAQAADQILFEKNYVNKDYAYDHLQIPIDNWKNSPKI